jgi:MFS family permease
MDRSLWAVMAGTFTLRFSTGLTGAMLGVYLAKLPEHGGPEVAATTLGLLSASFFLSELVLSPAFGILSDRIGHHRVMLFGPVFGAIAVVLTGLTTNLFVLGGTRLLEGASTAASVPSILGYIAIATATSEVLRGKAAARFEGATLAGIGVGIAIAPLLFAALGPTAFFLNALVYGVSFLIYRFGVADRDREERALAATERKSSDRTGWQRYRSIITNEYVLLLAPTWIAVNASIGIWFSQSIFQFSKADPRFPDQFMLQGFSPIQISVAAVVIGLIFGAGLLWWGKPVQDAAADDDHLLRDPRRWRDGPRCLGHQPRGAGCACSSPGSAPLRRRSGCSCSRARRPPRLGCSPTSPSDSRPTGARSWAFTACSSGSARSSAA